MLIYKGYSKDLNELAGILKEREKQGFGDETVDYLLVRASRLACKSLNHLLVEDSFWNWVHLNENASQNESFNPRDFEEIVVPVNSSILRHLHYQGPPTPQEILKAARDKIEAAKQACAVNTDEIKDNIKKLMEMICSLYGRADGLISARIESKYAGHFWDFDGENNLRIWKSIPVKKLLNGIIETTTILANIITIMTGIHDLTQPDPEKKGVHVENINIYVSVEGKEGRFVTKDDQKKLEIFWRKYLESIPDPTLGELRN